MDLRKIKNFYNVKIVLLLFLLEAFVFAVITPPFEAPDEIHHLDYINYFAKHSELPIQNIPEKKVEGEGHQNPLYYVVAGTLVKILTKKNEVECSVSKNKEHIWNGGAKFHVPLFERRGKTFPNFGASAVFYLLRFFSVFLGFGVLLTINKTLELLKIDERIVFFTVAFFSFLPQFVFISSVINNDMLSVFLTSLALYYFYAFFHKENSRNIFKMFLFLALSVWSKFYAFGLVVPFLTAILLFSKKRHDKKIFLNLIFGVILFVILLLPLFARNLFYYGNPLGYAVEPNGGGLFDLPFTQAISQFANLFVSFVGKFGWGNVTLPFVIYSIYAIFLLILAVCFLRNIGALVKRHDFLYSLFFAAIMFFEILFYNLHYVQMQGRFLLPISVALAVVIANILTVDKKIFTRDTTVFVIGGLFFILSLVSLAVQYDFYN